ncbi:hypothetical protein M3Y99_01242200 [Aphelenchoides fujianensis]|nr:hypothetical protein M3Y99_01242200 [Aphelenchoides fujianensis]
MVVNLQKQLQDQLCVISQQQPLSVDYVNQYPSLLAQTLLLASSAAQLSPTSPEMSAQQQGSNGSVNGMETGGSPSSSHSNSAEMNGGDAEGVWSADIDQAFHEALEIYPPCGRRKIILSEEGKMYGRNELIARYIKLRCGKTRTRKQVSSHIQVLARKQNRESKSKVKTQEIKLEDPQTSAPFGSPHKSAAAVESAFHAATHSTAAVISAAASMANFPQVLATSVAAGSLEAQQTKLKSLADAAGVTSTLLPPAAAALKRENVSPAAFSAAAAASAVGNPAVSAVSALQWPYAMMPNMFNNNVYGNLNGMSNDENLYLAAAFSAQQQMNAFSPSAAATSAAANTTVAATNPLSAAAAMDLGKLLPTLLPNFPAAAAANGLFNANSAALSAISGQQQPDPMRTLAERRIASQKLVLNGFVAYLERTTADGETERVNIVTIPQFSEEPLETIHLEAVKKEFPPVLEELFAKAPPEAFFLVKCWANVSFDIDDNDQSCLYAVDSFYDSPENFELSISSRVCSFGDQQVEKVEVYSAIESSGPAPQTFHYRLEKSPMCEYMAIFMRKLKSLEDRETMNRVLERFTVLQVVTNKQTDEPLMVIAFTFEVSPEPESSCRVYKLIN